MAYVHTDYITINVSKLLKKNEKPSPLVDKAVCQQIEAVLGEILADETVIVEASLLDDTADDKAAEDDAAE